MKETVYSSKLTKYIACQLFANPYIANRQMRNFKPPCVVKIL